MGARRILTQSGFISTVAYEISFVQSAAVEQGKAIVGIKNKYFGTLAGEKKLEYSDHFKFLDDSRTYKIKMLGNGLPKDNSSFVVVDISGIAPQIPKVITIDQTPAP